MSLLFKESLPSPIVHVCAQQCPHLGLLSLLVLFLALFLPHLEPLSSHHC